MSFKELAIWLITVQKRENGIEYHTLKKLYAERH